MAPTSSPLFTLPLSRMPLLINPNNQESNSPQPLLLSIATDCFSPDCDAHKNQKVYKY